MRKTEDLLIQAGENGDADAYFRSGMELIQNPNAYRSYAYPNQKSYRYLGKAAEMGHVDAMFIWGRQFIDREDCASKAQTWLHQAVEAGSSEAALILGKKILDDKLATSHEQGIEYLEKAVNRDNNEEAMRYLGEYYMKFPEEGRIKQGENWLRSAAEAGDKKAMRLLGKAYITGNPFAKDIDLGIDFYQQAIEKEDLEAMKELSDYLLEGKEVPQDLDLGRSLLERVANTPSNVATDLVNQANLRLALYLSKGELFPKDMKKSIRYLRRATNGNDQAAYEYATLLYEGKEVKRDVKLARDYLRRVLWYGTSELRTKAKWLMGMLFLESPHSDPNQAKRYLQDAAHDGHTEAMRDLGEILMEGTYVPKDVVTGERWLQKAVDQGDEQAFSNLAYYYLSEQTQEKKKEKGIQMLQEGAEKGYAAVLNQYGWRLIAGNTVVKDVDRGVSYLRQAVEKGDSYAFANLGTYLCSGYQLPKDVEEGERLLRRAIEMGNTFGMTELARQIQQGNVKASERKAEDLLLRAAELGDSDAMLELGKCYSEGKGMNRDSNQALYYLHMASEAYNSEAKKELEKYLQNDTIRWIKLAAESGNTEAQYTLGMRYAYGIGVDQSRYEARTWLQRARGAGHPEAQKLLSKL